MIKELENLPKQRLAEIWCEINKHEIPKELADIDMSNHNWDWECMLEINNKIGNKECLKQWHIDQKIKGEFNYAKIMRSK